MAKEKGNAATFYQLYVGDKNIDLICQKVDTASQNTKQRTSASVWIFPRRKKKWSLCEARVHELSRTVLSGEERARMKFHSNTSKYGAILRLSLLVFCLQ